MTRAFQETSRFSGRHELITPNRVVRNCELLVIGLTWTEPFNMRIASRASAALVIVLGNCFSVLLF